MCAKICRIFKTISVFTNYKQLGTLCSNLFFVYIGENDVLKCVLANLIKGNNNDDDDHDDNVT